MYYAHTKSDPVTEEKLSPEQWQPLSAHLQNVAALAFEFADEFESGALARLCGLFHDLGKYSGKFQKHLLEDGPRVDHSTAGAQELSRRFGTLGFLLAYCVAGHHAGLPDGGTKAATADDPALAGRLKKKVEPYDGYAEEFDLKKEKQELQLPIRPLEGVGFSLAFYIRMLFSCLVDGDCLDTETAMNGEVDRKIGEDIPTLAEKLEEYIQRFGEPRNDIDRKRTQILHDCMAHAEWEKGLYTLTVPTGGGKTISSLAFALKHAKRHGMRRVIYVIPYNSIIEQNAAVFKDILGEDSVLEHHSNFNYDDSSERLIRQRLATENWNMPVIVTTTVQLFESLFANRSSKCRKLHNLAESVVIFDEAQMLPLPYLKPCVRAIAELVYNYGCTAVLCSATQPALGNQFPKELHMRELCGGTGELYSFFRRTELKQTGPLADAELAKRLNAEKQVLCIVNTRAQAQALFLLLEEEGSFHLSTLMYPKHRSQVLDEIRQRLQNGKPCRVVATSLIEAGVDVDFPVVYRAQAGLDSQIQAAGRCNREGKRDLCPVYIFEPEEKYRKHLLHMQKRPAEIARSVAGQFADCASPEAITAYFQQLYHAEDENLDNKNIVQRFEEGYQKGLRFPFATAAGEFRLIENVTRSVLIADTDDARKLAEALRSGQRSRKLLRQVQQYCVNIYENHYQALYGAGCIRPLDDEIAELIDLKKYSRQTGLEAKTDTGVGVFV